MGQEEEGEVEGLLHHPRRGVGSALAATSLNRPPAHQGLDVVRQSDLKKEVGQLQLRLTIYSKSSRELREAGLCAQDAHVVER